MWGQLGVLLWGFTFPSLAVPFPAEQSWDGDVHLRAVRMKFAHQR